MSSIDAGEVLSRIHRLDQLVTAYGHILIASELDRPLPSVVPLLVGGDLTESDAGGLVKEILRRGGAALLVDLEEVERLVRQAKKDPEITTALRRVRLAFRQTARLHAGALARRLGRDARAGTASGPETGSLQKELETFINGVARAIREDDGEVEEVFADEDLLTGDEEMASEASGSFLSKEAQANGPAPAASVEEPEPAEVTPAVLAADERLSADETAPEAETAWPEPEPSPPGPQAPEPSILEPVEAAPPQDDGDAEERPLDWLRDRVDVYNEMLARWGAGEAFVPEASPLVRRGMLTVERCAALYRDLLESGAQGLVARFEELEASPGAADDRLRYLRGRIADGLATALPRILALLASGEPLPPDMAGRSDGREVFADLSAYLARAVNLFEDASPLHARLSYLASELRGSVPIAPR